MQTPNDLKPIPIPRDQKWREFRVAYLPVITFSVLLVIIGWMWVRYVAPATIVGEVEAVRVDVLSLTDGTVQELKVDRLQSVTNGQDLAVISAIESDQLAAEIAAVEADLRLMKARMDLDRTRNFNSFAQLKTDLQVETLELDVARIRLAQVEAEFDRAKKLLDQQLTAYGSGAAPSGTGLNSDFGYDVALRDRNDMRAQVAAREKTTAELQTAVQRLQNTGAGQIDGVDPVIENAIAAEREKLQRLLRPVTLRSPINGFVSIIEHLPGEKLPAGERVLVVSAEKSHRILAWVRQPVTDRPHEGDIVQVRRGTLGQASFEATVAKVGKQLEQINATAVPLSATLQQAEFGLPLIVNVDPNIELIPGEAVQIRVIRRAAAN